MPFVNQKEDAPFKKDGRPVNTEQFWIGVLQYNLGVILNEDNSNQIDLQERIKHANKTYFMLQKYFKNKNISKKLKQRQ